jgi:hypothetical protein
MKHNELSEFFQKNALQLSLQIIGLVVVIVNLWLITKLSPLVADIASLKVNAQTATERFKEEDVKFQEFKVIETVVKGIDARLERIDIRLSKHLGI